ncbi:MAG: PorV/PorQ family protein [bacterium]|nr:PorV/PorQ family protein [bacterium]
MRSRDVLVGSILILALLALTVPTEVNAQAKVGTTGAQFLELGVSARAMGMAEAFSAVVDDISAVYYNPAGLTALYGREAALTYISMPADVSYGFGAVGLPLESIGGVLGVAAYALSSGEMIERTYERGTFEGTGRTFAWNDFALGVTYGRYLTDRFSIGLSVKYINQSVHDFSANGWAADVGTLYDTGYRGFKIGMVINNFGPDMKMIENGYPLPINFKFGASINVLEEYDHLLTFSAEGSHPSDNLEKYNSGLEYTFKDRFVLRAGSRFNYDVDGFTAGGGLRLPFGEEREIRVDYAFQDFGILTEVHRFTMYMAF